MICSHLLSAHIPYKVCREGYHYSTVKHNHNTMSAIETRTRHEKWINHFESSISTFDRYARPDVLRFTSPSTVECWCALVAGAAFSFAAISFCSEWSLLLPALCELSSGLSTPFNPNARRRLSDRSVKLGARGRWCPRARPPIQGISQRTIRYRYSPASKRIMAHHGTIVMRPRRNCASGTC